MTSSPQLALSVVSHGQLALVQGLLDELVQRRPASLQQVVLTLNLPEPVPQAPPGGWPFELTLIHSGYPVGFATNHNRAATQAKAEFFGIINPDIRLLPGESDPFEPLCLAASEPGVGVAYPRQVSPDGVPLDHERVYPTPLALLRRYALKARERRVDWVNGALMIMPLHLYTSMGGLDERFRMYCEDVDLCLRLRAVGLQLVAVPVTVVHTAQRASRRSISHLIWHVHSLFRLWVTPKFWCAVCQASTRQSA